MAMGLANPLKVVANSPMAIVDPDPVAWASLPKAIDPIRAASESAPIAIDPKLAKQAAVLAKCDLLTHMVTEFPNLQGVMGYYYALHDKEDPNVAQAIKEQYLPRFSSIRLSIYVCWLWKCLWWYCRCRWASSCGSRSWITSVIDFVVGSAD